VNHRWPLVAATLAFAALLLAACADGSDGRINVTTSVPSAPTVVIGKIDRFPGGTAVVTSEYVLQSMTCEAGVLTLTTSAGAFTGTMDCGQMVSPDIVGRFVGRPIVITISATRLRIEHPEAGSLDFPASGASQRE
jgi:hypothetical protein